MTTTTLEHVNVTVNDPDKTAAMLCQLFDWQIRWAGSSIHGGRSVHVGTRIQDPHVIGRILDHLKRTSALGAGYLPQAPRAPPKALLPGGTFDLD